jgi:hypothetical protein
MAQEVKVLCNFRDERLLKNDIGRSFIKFYYRHSPPVADFIRHKEPLKAIARILLKPIIHIIRAQGMDS